MEELKLGMEVRDVVSGMVGIVIGLSYWLHGTPMTAGVQAKAKEGDIAPESRWFDVEQLEVIGLGLSAQKA